MTIDALLFHGDDEHDESGRVFHKGSVVEWTMDSPHHWPRKGTRGKILEIIPHPNGMSRAVIHYDGKAPPMRIPHPAGHDMFNVEVEEPTPLFCLKVIA